MLHVVSFALPTIFFSIACLGAGASILRIFQQRTQEYSFTETALAFLLGQGIFGSVFVFPALMGAFTTPVILVLTAPFACIGLWWLYVAAKGTPTVARNFYRSVLTAPLLWQAVAFSVIFLLLAWGASIVGRVEGDAHAFYLALPKVIAASHRLVPLPAYEPFTSVGLLAEMQLATLFLLGMPGASVKLFCWLTILASAAILRAISKMAGIGKRGQIICLAILATSSAVIILLEGKTDFFAAAYALAAVLYALKSWAPATRRYSIILAGLFTGFTLVAKLSYIVAFLPTISLLLFWNQIQHLWQLRREKGQFELDLKKCLKEGLLWATFTAFAFFPHLTKNIVLFGTFYDTYGSHQYFSNETTRRIVLTYPFGLVFGKYWGQLGNVSPLLLAFLPLALLAPWPKKSRDKPVLAICVAALVGLFAWIAIFPAVPMPRYFLATLLLLAVPTGWVAERCTSRSRILSYAVTVGTLVTLHAVYKRWEPEVFPIKTAYEYLASEQNERTLNINETLFRDGYEAINRVAPPGARVFLASYFRFWLRPDLIQCTNSDYENSSIKWDAKNPEKFWRQLHEYGFEFLYMDSTQRLSDALKAAPYWVSIEELYPKGAQYGTSYGSAFRLVFRNPPGKALWRTQEISPGAWDVTRTPFPT